MPVLNIIALKPEDLIILAGGQIGIVIEPDDINPGVYYKVLVNGLVHCIHRDDMIIIDEESAEEIQEIKDELSKRDQ